MTRKILIWTLIVTLNWNGLAWAADPPPPQTNPTVTYKQALERLDRFMGLIEKLRSHIDRSQFDLDALLEKLDYDADKIIKFVKEEIYFEQYPGLLRGAEGTLKSRAGNSLDQSVLLATLFKNAGFGARVVQGTLSLSQAEALLATMTKERTEQSPYTDENAFNSVLRKIWKISGQTESEFEAFIARSSGSNSPLQAKYHDIVQKETEFILQQLTANDIALGSPLALNDLVEEARDYFWVEYRLGPSSGWLNAHPAIGGANLNTETIPAEKIFAERIPAELQHRFRFDVILEQDLNGNVRSQQLLKPWERPTANLVEKRLTFTSIPLSFFEQISKGKIDVPEGRNEIFVPVFLGDYADTAFDLLGNVVPLDAALSNYAALFATSTEKLSNAAISLSSIGKKQKDGNEPAIGLSSLKIRFVFVEPGGKETEYWRTVFSRQAQGGQTGATQALQTYRALTQNYTFMIATGSSSPAALLDTMLRAVEEKQGIIEVIIAQVFSAKSDVNAASKKKIVDTSWIGLPVLYGIFDSYREGLTNGTYRHQPSLLAYRVSLPLQSPPSEHMDVVQNKRRLLAMSGSGSPQAVKSLIGMGVWESVTEGLLLGKDGALVQNTQSMFEEYRESGMGFQVIQPDNIRLIADLDIGEVEKTNLTRELQRGFTVILPGPRDLADASTLFWWRVNTRTGETLGIGRSGEGTAIAEYLGGLTLVAAYTIVVATTIGCLMVGRTINEPSKEILTGGDCVALGTGAGGSFLLAAVGAGFVAGFGLAVAMLALGKVFDFK
ncbi:MAG: hypothetical protein BMS9Abin30_0333 [Gammaproteobacteria bacterium]|nr:MAG: hypothetical protein BMS9Abin30_0333 [Gammaproteobacteria bacterium]